MKNLIFTLSFLLLMGCKKNKIEICDTDNCKQYYQIWENIFKTQNDISDAYFKKHIKVYKTNISENSYGTQFNISFKINIDWVSIDQYNKFMIKATSTKPEWRYLRLNTGNYLDESDIKYGLENHYFNSAITFVKPIEHLHFKTKKDAKKELNRIANNAKVTKIFIKSIKRYPKLGGNIYMNGATKCINNYNTDVEINLGNAKFIKNERFCGPIH